MRIETTTDTAAKKLSSTEFSTRQFQVQVFDTYGDLLVHCTVTKHQNFYAVDTREEVLDSSKNSESRLAAGSRWSYRKPRPSAAARHGSSDVERVEP